MCGEHVEPSSYWPVCLGSSPHVRGARVSSLISIPSSGIIPACAGSTSPRPKARQIPRDHPRMCGEHTRPASFIRFQRGSSPHVRGARDVSRIADFFDGIIPACAGSTAAVPELLGCAGDHPRMCGEHHVTTIRWLTSSGSSPHVRGALVGHLHGLRDCGIIPACAGSTPYSHRHISNQRDHPRMCGEHISQGVQYGTAQGSSPHVRGAQKPHGHARLTYGIIPACAGSTLRK